MAKKPNLKLIGLFLVGGFLLIGATLFLLLEGKFFSQDDNTVVMFFDESVTGLNVGAPVVFKGVEIGKVSKIGLFYDPSNMEFKIPVYARIPNKQKTRIEEFSVHRSVVDALIQKGLRARLGMQSYLTGQLMIEWAMIPGAPLDFQNTFSNMLEIPTVPSLSSELSKGIQDLPVKESLEKFNLFFDTLNKQVPVLLPELTKLLDQLNNVIKKNEKVSSEVLINANRTLSEISAAAKAFKNFADYIERHPEALLRGKKGGY